MSNLEEPQKVLEIDPIVDLGYDIKDEQVVKKGVVERTIIAQASDSFSDSNILFQNIAPSSLTTVTDRCFRIRYKLQAQVKFNTLDTATGTNAVALPGKYPFPNAVVGAGVTRVFPQTGAGVAAAAYVAGQPAVDPVTALAGTYVGSNGGAGVNDINYTMGLRSFPLNSCLVTDDLKLNGGATSIATNDFICIQPYLMSQEELMYFECPVQRDNSALYKATDNVNDRNPFNKYNQNVAVPSRGSYKCTLMSEAIDAATAGRPVTRVYQWEIVEPLIIPPLLWGNSFNEKGFANLVNITIQLRIQDIQRSICVASGLNADATIDMSLTKYGGDANAELLLNFCTQDPVLSAKQPSMIRYDWDLVQIDANSNTINANLNNASPAGKFNGNALRLSAIPDKIYVFIKPSKSNYNGATCQTIPDTFLRIKQLRVQFQNTSNILASFSEYDLWRMSVKNGLKMDWNEWRYSNGSIVIMDTAEDLGLKSDESAGEEKYNQIKIDGDYDCTPLVYAGQTQAVKYDVMTIVVTAGECQISPNTARFETGGVDSAQVLALSTTQDNVIASGLRRKMSTRGGSLFSNVGRFLHRSLKTLKDNPEYVSKGVDLAQKGLDMMGIGGSGFNVTGGKLKRAHKRVV